jgi:hypothetical protein
MSGSDSEASDFDTLSPMTSSLYAAAGPARPSYSRHLSFDTTQDAKRPEDTPQRVDTGEDTPLLSGVHDSLRRYHSTPAFNKSPRPRRVTDPAAAPTGQDGLRRKISRVLTPKAYDYDADKHSLAAVGSGERVWFGRSGPLFDGFRTGDYRTIDWIHDSVKDQFRKKKLRRMKGVRGAVLNFLDSIEGWVLVGVIGLARME